MAPEIRRLHWSSVPDHLVREWSFAGGSSFAVWPAPVDHDACFENAGFRDFADTDEAWDKEFAGLLDKLLVVLNQAGRPIIRQSQQAEKAETLVGRVARIARRKAKATPSLSECVLLPARDDQFTACILDFGDPAEVRLRTSGGHPILWLCLTRQQNIDRILRELKADTPVQETVLDWAHLA